MRTMRPKLRLWRRCLAAGLVALHAGVTLGAGVHDGPHFETDVAWLPIDLHHHAYGLVAASPEPPRPLDPCVACQLSRLVPRLPAPAMVLAAGGAPAAAVSVAAAAPLPLTELDAHSPRAPPTA